MKPETLEALKKSIERPSSQTAASPMKESLTRSTAQAREDAATTDRASGCCVQRSCSADTCEWAETAGAKPCGKPAVWMTRIFNYKLCAEHLKNSEANGTAHVPYPPNTGRG